ncbi:MAG: hypothetical protein ACKVRP_02370 [Bacteroidota bacterium]
MSRTLNLGRVEELKREIHNHRVYVDTLAKGLIDVLGPIDMAMLYTSDIDMNRVMPIVREMKKKVEELKRLVSEKETIERELGE